MFLFILKYSLNQALLYNNKHKGWMHHKWDPTALKVIEELDRYRNRAEKYQGFQNVITEV
jgi:hypothetical protein